MPSKDPSRRAPQKPRQPRNQTQYKQQTNGLCVTLYSPHGASIPPRVQEAAARAIQEIARDNHLLIGLANA